MKRGEEVARRRARDEAMKLWAYGHKTAVIEFQSVELNRGRRGLYKRKKKLGKGETQRKEWTLEGSRQGVSRAQKVPEDPTHVVHF